MEDNLGGGAVNTTHLMTFQEQAHHDKHSLHVPVEGTKKRKFSALEDNEHIAFTIDTVAEPPHATVTGKDTSFQQSQFVWTYLRKCNY